jgi:adsorption protein B
VGNLLTPAANLLSLYIPANCLWSAVSGQPWHLGSHIPLWLARACVATLSISVVQAAVRVFSSARIYGWRFAAASPLRTFWGNLVNFAATVEALRQFLGARVKHHALAWRKTEHVYPQPRLGEVLVRMNWVSTGEVEEAVHRVPAGLRLGEYLVQLRRISEEYLYQALSFQAGIPLGLPPGDEVSRLATRAFPAEAARRWKVMPYRVATGQLHVITAEVPSEEMTRELASLSALEIRFRMVRPWEFEELAGEYLPRR